MKRIKSDIKRDHEYSHPREIEEFAEAREEQRKQLAARLALESRVPRSFRARLAQVKRG